MLLAEQRGRAAEAKELLFQAIYERGQNVSDATTLNALGQELGLTGVSPSGLKMQVTCSALNNYSDACSSPSS